MLVFLLGMIELVANSLDLRPAAGSLDYYLICESEPFYFLICLGTVYN